MSALRDADVRMALAERLRAAMDARGVTRHALAKAIHVTPSAVYWWAEGRREPSAESIRRVCYALEVSADWLLGLKGEMER